MYASENGWSNIRLAHIFEAWKLSSHLPITGPNANYEHPRKFLSLDYQPKLSNLANFTENSDIVQVQYLKVFFKCYLYVPDSSFYQSVVESCGYIRKELQPVSLFLQPTTQTVLWESEWQRAFVSGRVVTELVIYQASTGYISLYILFFCKQSSNLSFCRQPWVTVLYQKKCFKLLQSIHAQMLVKTFYQAP